MRPKEDYFFLHVVLPTSTPSRTLGPMTLSWCGDPVNNGTPRTDRKRGVPKWTETSHGGPGPIGLAA